MTIAIRHKLTSAVSDAQASGYIKPSNWNDTHDISLAANSLLGNPTNSPTYAREIGISGDFAYSGSDLVLGATGATAGAYTNANVTVDSKGRVTAVSSGVAGGVVAASQFILGSADASYPNARVLTDATAITWNETIAGQVKAILGQFTGDVTNASTDSLALTIGTNKVVTAKIADANVTYAKIANGTGLSVVGVTGSAAAVNADIVGTTDQVLRVNSAGNALGFGTIATGGIAANAVTYAKIAQGTGLSVLGVTGASAANNADIVGTADQVLRVNTAGTALGFGTIATGGIAAAAVTYAKIQNVAGLSVFGRSASTSGVGADITGTANQFLQVNAAGNSLGFVTMSTDATLSGGALTIANSAVTFAKMQNSASAGLSVVGRSTNSAGVFAEIAGADGQALRVNGTTLAFGTLATAAYADASVTYAKIANVAGLSVMGRSANSSGVPADITGADKQILRVSGTTLSFGTIDLSSTSAVANQLASASMPALTGATVSAGGTLSTTATIDLVFIVGDGTNVISTGVTGNWATIDFGCTIVQWSILAHESGSISIDVWKTTYSSFDAGSTHPVAADKISSSAPITFSTATKAQDSTLTGWTKTVSAGDVLAFNVASVTTCKQVVISLKVTKTS